MCYDTVLMLPIAFIASLSFLPTADAGESWAAVAGAGEDKKDLEPMLEQYLLDGLPKHGEYPRLVEASTLGLVGETAWVMLIALPADEAVAIELTGHLDDRRFDARVVRAQSAESEELRLLSIDSVSASGNGAPLFVFTACLAGAMPDVCYGVSRPDDEGRLLVAWVPAAEKEAVQLFADVGDPWICGGITLGYPREGLVWRRGASTASCYEPAPTKSRRR